ncbi:regulator of protease activity HflC (stomatin/prohibitin superfamily) [Geothermobacter ehrlichii]|uniref:Regulator of protease activity HflC (Stomatin/prohibitin superfamily) n=1 Tax=Geothermobacter ehrlichii TaxID=213224 RepID=A0A5D3WK01_9BACT|nr:SPFH domain-containing protein [Geothermobacter ehrlichii]TYO98931.1 regulator of protease activity HflC (stomatin/prohibitin superfamily) [Geothermobacter ehrlichii]
MQEEQRYRFLQRVRVKRYLKQGLLLLFLGVVLYGLFALVYATRTFYKVRRNYAVILEDLSGERRVVSEVGWHGRLPFFTRIELEVPLMNQELYLGGTAEPQRIISRGNVALWTSAMLTYRIRDLERWGIENKTAQVLLQTDFDGIVKDVMQGHPVDDLISSRERIKEEIFRALKERAINRGGPTLEEKYGIEVVSFVLRDTRFGEKLAQASEEKKRRELIAEAENYAADQEASRTRKLYAAYSEAIRQMRDSLGLQEKDTAALFAFLNQQKWATAYEKNQTGQNTFVLNNANFTPSLALPPPAAPAAGGKGE